MKIKSYKKLNGSKYKIVLDKMELITYEDLILKYKLLLKKDISLDDINTILEENRFYEAYYLALKYISTKMRNKKEIRGYLKRKEVEDLIISDVIDKLTLQNLLNDKAYIKAFINDKIYLNNYGPYKIKQELINSEMDCNEIDNYLTTIGEDIWINQINKLIKKKIATGKKLSSYKLKSKIINDLYNLGYEKSMIEQELIKYNLDEANALEKEYQKAYKKYSKQYEGDTLFNNIKTYLYKKGFSSENIIDYINKNN